jgi:flagellar hook-length control protein FliK
MTRPIDTLSQRQPSKSTGAELGTIQHSSSDGFGDLLSSLSSPPKVTSDAVAAGEQGRGLQAFARMPNANFTQSQAPAAVTASGTVPTNTQFQTIPAHLAVHNTAVETETTTLTERDTATEQTPLASAGPIVPPVVLSLAAAAGSNITPPSLEGQTSIQIAPAQPNASTNGTAAGASADVFGTVLSGGLSFESGVTSAQNASATDLSSLSVQSTLQGATAALGVGLDTVATSASLGAVSLTQAVVATTPNMGAQVATGMEIPHNLAGHAGAANPRKTAPFSVDAKPAMAAALSLALDTPRAADKAAAALTALHQATTHGTTTTQTSALSTQPTQSSPPAALQRATQATDPTVVPRTATAENGTIASTTSLGAVNVPESTADIPVTASIDPLVPIASATLPNSTADTRLFNTPAAPTADTAAPIRQVAAALVELMPATGGSAMTLRLNPEELGKVQIQIVPADDGSAAVHVAVERPETLRLLIADQQQLHLALDNAGVSQEGRTLTLTLSAPDVASSSVPASDNSSFSANSGFNNESTRSDAGSGFSSNNGSGGRQGGGQWRQERTPYADTDNVTSASTTWLRAGVDITA